MSTMAVEQVGILDALSSINTYHFSSQLEVPSGEKAAPPIWTMLDFFSKLFLPIVLMLGGKQSPDLIKFHHFFQKFRDIAFSRFCTSLEEKGTIDSYHAKIFQREEKAIKDLAALERQLQYEREERVKAFSRYQATEQHLHQEEELVKEEALEAEQNLETEFNALEEHELKNFQAEEFDLNTKCTELRALLLQLQVENRENELSLRGKKEQSADEVRNLLTEYNQDIQMRNEDLQKIRQDHEITRAKLEVYQNYFRNKELEEAKKLKEERLKTEAILAKLKRKEDAIVFIQFAWRRHQRRKRAKDSAEKKEKGKQDKKGTTSSKLTKKKGKGSTKSPAKKGKAKK